MFDTFNFKKYTSEMCYSICFQIGLEGFCNCSDASIPQIQNLTLCSSAKQISCQETYFQSFYSSYNAECQKQCPKGEIF